MQEKRYDRVVEMRLCFFSGKVGDYKMLFVATRKCRSTIDYVEKEKNVELDERDYQPPIEQPPFENQPPSPDYGMLDGAGLYGRR